MGARSWAVDGVHWYDKPKPSFFHRCKPSTMGIVDGYTVSRCACGAMRVNGGSWYQRNSRKGK